MQGYVDRGEIEGVVTAVARKGEVHVAAYGSARRDTIFRISSMTKPITAAATLMLVDDGVLALDAPVERWLPELADRRVLRRPDAGLDDTVPAQRAFTVRELLTFTFGFGIVFDASPIAKASEALALGQGMPAPQTPPAPDEWLRRFATLPLMHQPGERWMYNTGSDLLGVLIGRAAKAPFEDVLRERVFEPLGMRDTAFHVPPEKRARFVPSLLHDGTLYDPVDGQWATPPAFPLGGAGLVSTVDDYLAFSTMLLRGGDGLLSREAIAQMTRDQLTPAQKAATQWWPADWFDGHGWGFGVQVNTVEDAGGAVGTFGWDGGLGTSWRANAAEQTTMIVLTQRAFSSPQPPPLHEAFWIEARRA
jgi:CubicO group peptidase (beta-lactamase class C family)